MSAWFLFSHGLAGRPQADSCVGYVAAYDLDAAGGRGSVTFTEDPTWAVRFASRQEAFETWRQVSKVRPLRPDGKPNRPLTAYTCEVLEEGRSHWPLPT